MIPQKDTKIIAELRKNSRATVRDIAKATSMRPSTVHQRIKRLMKDKVIEKFTIKLNNKAAEENFVVFMLVKTEKDLDDRVFSNHHIKEVFGVTGEYDLMMKLKFKDIEEFNEFIIEFRKSNRINNTVTMVATINIKEEL
jgi:DNA-binding Lrp family transcriptional regulator